jgi:hypothetical protein
METDTVQPWHRGEELVIVCPESMSTGWLIESGGRLGQPVNVAVGTRVVVEALQVGGWTDVRVAEGRHGGAVVRLGSNEFVTRAHS